MPEPGENRAQLQELYLHLDGSDNPASDQRLAYYGQLRAQEHSHAEALKICIKHFYLEERDWYKKRMERINQA